MNELEPFPLPERRRPRVYIAGPISRGDLAHNVNQATAAFVALARAGFAPLCPHWSVYSKPARKEILTDDDGEQWPAVICEATAAGNPDMTHADWMGVDLPWVEVADAVVRLPGDSTGADLETAHARARGIPVFGSVRELTDGWADAAIARRMHGGDGCPGAGFCDACGV
ncbi:MAG: hypothetical protein V4515_00055 [Chloroflexota bacterium]